MYGTSGCYTYDKNDLFRERINLRNLYHRVSCHSCPSDSPGVKLIAILLSRIVAFYIHTQIILSCDCQRK
jgi:hypothetical protein